MGYLFQRTENHWLQLFTEFFFQAFPRLCFRFSFLCRQVKVLMLISYCLRSYYFSISSCMGVCMCTCFHKLEPCYDITTCISSLEGTVFIFRLYISCVSHFQTTSLLTSLWPWPWMTLSGVWCSTYSCYKDANAFDSVSLFLRLFLLFVVSKVMHKRRDFTSIYQSWVFCYFR